MRLYKTRTLATKACNAGRVRIKDLPVKASKVVEVGDPIAIKVNPIWRTFNVLAIPKSRLGPKLVSDYIVETTPQEDLELLEGVRGENRQNRSAFYQGRPTKKTRRDIDRFRK